MAASTQGEAPTIRPRIRAWSTTVATSANLGPQGGMRATDTAAASIQAEIPGALGVKIAGIPIEEDHIPDLPEDSDDGPADNK